MVDICCAGVQICYFSQQLLLSSGSRLTQALTTGGLTQLPGSETIAKRVLKLVATANPGSDRKGSDPTDFGRGRIGRISAGVGSESLSTVTENRALKRKLSIRRSENKGVKAKL